MSAKAFMLWVWWVWWELVWVCASHHMLHAGMSTISVPVPFHGYARPKTPYEQFWNNEHPHVFAVHHTHTTSERKLHCLAAVCTQKGGSRVVGG